MSDWLRCQCHTCETESSRRRLDSWPVLLWDYLFTTFQSWFSSIVHGTSKNLLLFESIVIFFWLQYPVFNLQKKSRHNSLQHDVLDEGPPFHENVAQCHIESHRYISAPTRQNWSVPKNMPLTDILLAGELCGSKKNWARRLEFIEIVKR